MGSSLPALRVRATLDGRHNLIAGRAICVLPTYLDQGPLAPFLLSTARPTTLKLWRPLASAGLKGPCCQQHCSRSAVALDLLNVFIADVQGLGQPSATGPSFCCTPYPFSRRFNRDEERGVRQNLTELSPNARLGALCAVRHH